MHKGDSYASVHGLHMKTMNIIDDAYLRYLSFSGPRSTYIFKYHNNEHQRMTNAQLTDFCCLADLTASSCGLLMAIIHTACSSVTKYSSSCNRFSTEDKR